MLPGKAHAKRRTAWKHTVRVDATQQGLVEAHLVEGRERVRPLGEEVGIPLIPTGVQGSEQAVLGGQASDDSNGPRGTYRSFILASYAFSSYPNSPAMFKAAHRGQRSGCCRGHEGALG